MKIQVLKADSKSAFNYLAGINRPVIPNHVTKLSNSINKMGVIRPVVIAVISFITGKPLKYIIDGQHLFNALLRNNMDIPYVVVHIDDQRDLIEKIALLNASSKSWALMDYIIAWSSINEDYRKLNNYFNIYDFELGTIASMLSGQNISQNGGSHISKNLKNGTFKITNEIETVRALDYLTDMFKVIPRMGRFENKYVCAEFISFYRSNYSIYDHKKMMSNLKKNRDMFVLATQQENKLSNIFRDMLK